MQAKHLEHYLALGKSSAKVAHCFFSHLTQTGASKGGGNWWEFESFRGTTALGRNRAQAARKDAAFKEKDAF